MLLSLVGKDILIAKKSKILIYDYHFSFSLRPVLFRNLLIGIGGVDSCLSSI